MTSSPRRTDVVVVGAGHNGLATSAVLAELGVDHVVLERGTVAERWRRERWDSMRLLTPNWMASLPGWTYADAGGTDPDGFMTAAETARFIGGYAARLGAPVHTHTRVTAVRPVEDGFRVQTDSHTWRCRAVVLAGGAFGQPVVPAFARHLPAGVEQLHAQAYRQPGQLAPGGVLVVGASATGLQLAHEIHASGRPVTLAVGEHVRLPRSYRGRDIHWWMHDAGLLRQRIEDEPDPDRARRLPSPQLVGTPDHATLDLNVLRAAGVEIVGRLAGVRDGQALFSGGLRHVCALADLKLERLLDAIDAHASARGLDAGNGPPRRPAPTVPASAPRWALALGSEVRTVLWATGYRPELGWLQVPAAFDAHGRLRHDRGAVVAAPGLYVLGLPFMRRRQSSFIHGCEDDVREVCQEVVAGLRTRVAATEGGRVAARPSVAPRSRHASCSPA
jgi:putative flavoprotein involved in K+ transport